MIDLLKGVFIVLIFLTIGWWITGFIVKIKVEKKEGKKMGRKRVCENYCACVEENAETCERVILVVSEVTRVNINNITLDSHLKRDLSMDKEDVLELEADLEEEFGIEIPYGSLRGKYPIRDVVWEVLSCIAEKKE